MVCTKSNYGVINIFNLNLTYEQIALKYIN